MRRPVLFALLAALAFGLAGGCSTSTEPVRKTNSHFQRMEHQDGATTKKR
jgi:hypothetical protein